MSRQWNCEATSFTIKTFGYVTLVWWIIKVACQEKNKICKRFSLASKLRDTFWGFNVFHIVKFDDEKQLQFLTILVLIVIYRFQTNQRCVLFTFDHCRRHLSSGIEYQASITTILNRNFIALSLPTFWLNRFWHFYKN